MGQLYNTDNSSTAKFSTQDSTAFMKSNEVKADNGTYTFSQFSIYFNPGSQLIVSLKITGLETYGNQIDFINNPLQLNLNFRNCVIGEQLGSDNSCNECQNDTYLIQTPSPLLICKQCNTTKQRCFGRFQVAPAFGYWRSDVTSDSFVQCPKPQSCLEGNQSYLLGICAEGYTGIVCGNCIHGFSKTAPFTCGRCPPRRQNIGILIIIIIFLICYLIFLVRSTISSVGKEKQPHSVYIKILTNHFQMIGALSNIQFNWPQQIDSFFNSQTSVNSAPVQLFSFDCFIEGDQNQINQSDAYFIKLIIIGLLPFLLAFAVVCFWLIYFTIKNRKQTNKYKELKDRFIATLLILLYLFHPTISTAMFSSFNCIEIDTDLRLKDDVNFICYQGSHLFYVCLVSIPSIICWSIGIPLFILSLLIKSKDHIQQIDIKSELIEEERQKVESVMFRYSFLLGGYRFQYYYWEVLILYRKILISMFAVFFSVVSSEVQVLLIIFIVVVNWYIHNRYQPFSDEIYNNMEVLSLTIVLMTLYTGMYYITGKHYHYLDYEGLQWFFLILLLIPNSVFFSYWIQKMYLEVLRVSFTIGQLTFKIFTLGQYDYYLFAEKFMKEKQLKDMILRLEDNLKKKQNQIAKSLWQSILNIFMKSKIIKPKSQRISTNDVKQQFQKEQNQINELKKILDLMQQSDQEELVVLDQIEVEFPKEGPNKIIKNRHKRYLREDSKENSGIIKKYVNSQNNDSNRLNLDNDFIQEVDIMSSNNTKQEYNFTIDSNSNLANKMNQTQKLQKKKESQLKLIYSDLNLVKIFPNSAKKNRKRAYRYKAYKEVSEDLEKDNQL